MQKSISLFVASAIVCLSVPLAAGANTQLDSAIGDYKAHHYKEALRTLDAMERSGIANLDENAKVHYYVALCSQGLGQIAAAKDNYGWVYLYARDPGLRANAQAGWESIEKWSKTRNYQGNGNVFVAMTSHHHSHH